jgi:hypothetical protein
LLFNTEASGENLGIHRAKQKNLDLLLSAHLFQFKFIVKISKRSGYVYEKNIWFFVILFCISEIFNDIFQLVYDCSTDFKT